MKVFIKNRITLIASDSYVVNENNEPMFTVKGWLHSPMEVKRIYDKYGVLLYTLRNRWLNLFSYKTYINDADGKRVATLKKGRFDLSKNYKILDTEEKIAIDGNFPGRKYFITKNGKDIGTVSHDQMIFGDSYALSADEKDIPFLTALVIALDTLREGRMTN